MNLFCRYFKSLFYLAIVFIVILFGLCPINSFSKINAATQALSELAIPANILQIYDIAFVDNEILMTTHEIGDFGEQYAVWRYDSNWERVFDSVNDDDMLERLQLVNSEINRLTGRLNDLLAYSRQTPEKAKHIDLYQLINELITLLKYQVKENISLRYQVEENTKVFLPESELRQALLNLLLNSIQSIGAQTGTVNLQVKHLQNKLIIEISDSGAGFPEFLLEQGIRPFASYKEQGTGLGLPMVQRFAKSQGGMLELNNDSQGHACASLILPDSE